MRLWPRHKTIRVRVGDMDASIDEMLAPLIKRLWQCGILTTNCCQENKIGISWIEFMTPGDATDFLNVVADIPSKRDLKNYNFWDTLYGRMSRCGGFGEWEYSINTDNIGEKRGDICFNFTIGIRFPQTDIPAITKAFEDFDRVTHRLRH